MSTALPLATLMLSNAGQTGAGKTHTMSSLLAALGADLEHGKHGEHSEGQSVTITFFEVSSNGCTDLLSDRAKIALRPCLKGGPASTPPEAATPRGGTCASCPCVACLLRTTRITVLLSVYPPRCLRQTLGICHLRMSHMPSSWQALRSDAQDVVHVRGAVTRTATSALELATALKAAIALRSTVATCATYIRTGAYR